MGKPINLSRGLNLSRGVKMEATIVPKPNTPPTVKNYLKPGLGGYAGMHLAKKAKRK